MTWVLVRHVYVLVFCVVGAVAGVFLNLEHSGGWEKVSVGVGTSIFAWLAFGTIVKMIKITGLDKQYKKAKVSNSETEYRAIRRGKVLEVFHVLSGAESETGVKGQTLLYRISLVFWLAAVVLMWIPSEGAFVAGQIAFGLGAVCLMPYLVLLSTVEHERVHYDL